MLDVACATFVHPRRTALSPVFTALLVVLLPVLAGLVQLLAGRRLGGQSGWLTGGALLVAAALSVGVLLSVEPAVSSRTEVRLQEAGQHLIRSAVERTFTARDADGNGALSGGELGLDRPARLPLAIDLDADGRVTRDELTAHLARQGGSWVVLGEARILPRGLLPDRTNPTTRAPLRLPLELNLDVPASLMVFVLAAVAALLCSHLLPGGASGDDSGATHPFAWISLATACLIGAVLSDSLLFGLIFWQAAVGLALLLQHSTTLDGAPNPVGAGSIGLLALGAAALLGALLVTGGQVGSWRYAELAAHIEAGAWPRAAQGATGLVLLAGLVVPCLVLPLRGGSPRSWAASQTLYAAGVTATAVFLLTRVHPLLSGSAGDVVTLLGGALAVVAAIRAVLQPRLDRALVWVSLAQLGGMILALGIGAWAAATLHLLTYALCQAGLFVAAESIHGEVATWELDRLGGLKRSHPLLFVGFVVCAMTLAGLPPLGGFLALRASVSSSLATLSPVGLTAAALALLAALLTATCLLHLLAVSFLGKRQTHPPAGPAPRRHPLPLLLLALLGSLGLRVFAEVSWLDPTPPDWVLTAGAGAIDAFPQAALASWPSPFSRAARGVLTHLATFLTLATLAAGILFAWRLGRARRVAPRGGLLFRLDQRMEDMAPQRRIVQPLLRLANSCANLDRRVFQEWLTSKIAALSPLRVGTDPAEHDSDYADDTPRTHGIPASLIESALFVLLLVVALLAVLSQA